MNYTEVLNVIKNASLFDLYRLECAISNELESPERIKKLREKFRVGDVVSYFDKNKNALIKAVVLEKNQKKVLVQHVIDKEKWNIPYYFLNIDYANTDMHPGHREKLTRNHVKVGEFVGFNHDGIDITGMIVRLNQKTASVATLDRGRWRVSYGCLYKVIDAELAAKFDIGWKKAPPLLDII
ncbi:MAG TPA: hypothetical protein VLH77_03640 [Gammaproteobacteria bacterium]|nr:hypothetical protein [Gammaproteobacteria bacterium]